MPEADKEFRQNDKESSPDLPNQRKNMDGFDDTEDTWKMAYRYGMLGSNQTTENKPRKDCTTSSKLNRMKDIFNRNKIGFLHNSDIGSNKSTELPNKTFSINNLALKLANDKTINTENVLMNCDISNTTPPENTDCETRSSDIGCEEGEHNLGTIIREIYERSLKRNKHVDDKIKTLANVVTRQVQWGTDYIDETVHGLEHTVSCKKARKDADDLLSRGLENHLVKFQSTHRSDVIRKTDKHTAEFKTELVEPDVEEETTDIRLSETSVKNIIHVPEKPGNLEEKYEYFSRNVEMFLTREVPKLSQTAIDNVTVGPDTKDDNKTDNILVGNEKPFVCDICNRSFNQNSHLTRHMRIHTGDKPFQCSVCGKEFSQSGDKRRHERTHTSFRPYQCFICDKEFNQSGHLQRHLRIHSGHILYNNGEFDKELTRKKYTEEKEAAKDKTKKCPLCDKIFIKKYLLDRHVRSHTGETPYNCEECGKGFTRKDRLYTHKRIHTGEKPYCCKLCGKGFNQSSHLKTHIRTHTGDKPYICGLCGRGFAQSHDRKKHIRVHTGERPYTCPLCQKDFNDNSQLWRHMRTHDDFDQSEGTSFKCRVCDNEYEYSSQLLQHMKVHVDNERVKISLPDLVGCQNDSEMEEIKRTAETLVNDTITGSGNDTNNGERSKANDKDKTQSVSKDKTQSVSDIGDESSESSRPKWDGEMYITEHISSDSN